MYLPRSTASESQATPLPPVRRPLDFWVGGNLDKTQAHGGVGLLRAEAEDGENVRRPGNAGRAGCARGRRNPWLERSEIVLSRKSIIAGQLQCAATWVSI